MILLLLNTIRKTSLDIQIIVKYLMFWQELIDSLMTSNVEMSDLLTSISHHLRYEFYPKNQVLFKYGDKANKFYLVLDGKVIVLLPRETTVSMSEEEYFKYLNNLRKYEEFEIINKILIKAKNYPVRDHEYEFWLRNSYSVYMKNYGFHNVEHSEMMKKYNLVKGYDESKEEKVSLVSSKDYIERIKPKIDHTSDQKRKDIVIYEYFPIVYKNRGDKFGDMAFGMQSQKRTASIIIENDTHLATLEKKYFEAFVKDANEKRRKMNNLFLVSTNLFYGYDRTIFQKKYFNLFIEERLNKNNFLFRQGQSTNQLYFLKSGEIELFKVTSLHKVKKTILRMGEIPYEPEISLETPEFYKFLKEKMLIKINICKDGEILGLEDMCHKNKLMYSAVCCSNNCVILKLETQFYDSILENNELIVRNKINFLKDKYKITAERLNKILKTHCDLYFGKSRPYNSNKSTIKSSTKNLLNSTISVLNTIETNKSTNISLPILTKKEARLQKMKNTLSNVSTSTNFSGFKSISQIPTKREKYNSPLNFSIHKSIQQDKMTIESSVVGMSPPCGKGMFVDYKMSSSKRIGDLSQDLQSERIYNKFNLSNLGSENHIKKVIYESSNFPKRKINLKKDKNYETFQSPLNMKLSYFNHFNSKIGLIECIKIDRFNKSVSKSTQIDNNF